MVSSCIKTFFILQIVRATCTENATSCKSPSFAKATHLVQRNAIKIGKSLQPKADGDEQAFYHVTIATDHLGYFQRQKLASTALGFEHVSLGYGENWTGMHRKMELFCDFLRSKPSSSLVLVTDAYDVIVVANKTEVIRTFLNFEVDVVFSGAGPVAESAVSRTLGNLWSELALFDFCSLGQDCSNALSMGLINSGVMMGYASTLMDVWTRMLNLAKLGTSKTQSDQALLNSISLEGIRFAMDTERILIWNWQPESFESIQTILQQGISSDSVEDGYEIQDGRVMLARTGTRPAVIHGLAHRDMNKLSTRLCENLKVDCSPVTKYPFSQSWYSAYIDFWKRALDIVSGPFASIEQEGVLLQAPHFVHPSTEIYVAQDRHELSRILSPHAIEDKYTIVINTFQRQSQLMQSILHWCQPQCVHVAVIAVVWSEGALGFSVPSEILGLNETCSRPILFLNQSRNSLNNRFAQSNGIVTEAVLHVDDDVIIPCRDAEEAYDLWRANNKTLVGWYPRRVTTQISPKSKCIESSYGLFSDAIVHGSYNLILTKAAFIHREYMRMYTEEQPREILEHVQLHRNCEDIAMQFLVSNSSGLPPVWYRGRVTDHGLLHGISSAGGAHFKARAFCVALFTRIYGRFPLVDEEIPDRLQALEAAANVFELVDVSFDSNKANTCSP